MPFLPVLLEIVSKTGSYFDSLELEAKAQFLGLELYRVTHSTVLMFLDLNEMVRKNISQFHLVSDKLTRLVFLESLCGRHSLCWC